ncbi:hypothetical protein EI534_15655 [Pseudomonas frederiksbergensis]|nr:hypothetical protein [Pseudomonas frederiksbergensis]
MRRPNARLWLASVRNYGSDRNGKIVGWSVTAVIAVVSLVIAQKSYMLTRDSNDPIAQTCGAVVDARSSFLEVGAEAMTRNGEPGRSMSRDQLDRDLRKLTEFANRSNDPVLKKAATNMRMALAQALNLTPEKEGDEIWNMKLCLLDRFFNESEVISSKCRAEDLPSTPKPKGELDLRSIQSLCEGIFTSEM